MTHSLCVGQSSVADDVIMSDCLLSGISRCLTCCSVCVFAEVAHSYHGDGVGSVTTASQSYHHHRPTASHYGATAAGDPGSETVGDNGFEMHTLLCHKDVVPLRVSLWCFDTSELIFCACEDVAVLFSSPADS